MESLIFSFGLAEDLLSYSSLCPVAEDEFSASSTLKVGNPGNELSSLPKVTS